MTDRDFSHLDKIHTPTGRQNQKYPRLMYPVSDSQGRQTWVPQNAHYPEGFPETDAEEIARRVRNYPRMAKKARELREQLKQVEANYDRLSDSVEKERDVLIRTALRLERKLRRYRRSLKAIVKKHQEWDGTHPVIFAADIVGIAKRTLEAGEEEPT